MPGAPSPSSRWFDPLAEVQKLRDHLASHDKPIAFLFGAGTSAGVRGADGKPLVPAVAELTKRCRLAVEGLGGPFADAWKRIVTALPADHRTIEDVLSAVRTMRIVVSGSDQLAGLGPDELKTLETELQKTISREARPEASRFPTKLPHAALGRWLRRIERSLPVEIFTTNYDTVIERALEEEWVPVFDGFIGAHRPFFSAASLAREAMAPGRRWTRLWKVHGSVTWTSFGSPNETRILRGRETESGELILPSLLKYDESRKQPYVAMMDRLGRVLTEREDAFLVACGYSFSDQHINEVIFGSLEANPRLHAFALCHSDPAAASELVRAARRHVDALLATWLGGPKPITVLDVSAVPAEVLADVVGSMLALVYDGLFWGMRLPVGGKQQPLLLVLDEAHRFLPAGTDTAASRACGRIAREGRKYGVGLLAITQRPADVDPTILSQCGTMVALRVTNGADRGAISATVPDDLGGLTALLPSLRTGEGLVLGEALQIPSRVRINRAPERPVGDDPKLPDVWLRDRPDPAGYADALAAWRAQSTTPVPPRDKEPSQ